MAESFATSATAVAREFVSQTYESTGIEVMYRDQISFEKTLQAMVLDGKEKLHVISDFDFTLTKYYQEDGDSRSASCHMVLEHSIGLLPDTYCTAAKALQLKYHPIEADMSMDMDVKFRHMEDWVNAHNELFLQSGLTQDIIVTAVDRALATGKFRMRDGMYNMLSMLEEHGIPVLIFSAGISNVLECAIQRTWVKGQNITVGTQIGHASGDHTDTDTTCTRSGSDLSLGHNNINVISNRCLFNAIDGSLQGFSSPVLHVYNKSCHAFLDTNPHFALIQQKEGAELGKGIEEQRTITAKESENISTKKTTAERCNVFLFGDSLGDLKMCHGIEERTKHLLKIGFLNDKKMIDSQLEVYLSDGNYDMVVFGDTGLDVHHHLLCKVLNI